MEIPIRNQKSRTPKPDIPLKNEKSRALNNVKMICPSTFRDRMPSGTISVPLENELNYSYFGDHQVNSCSKIKYYAIILLSSSGLAIFVKLLRMGVGCFPVLRHVGQLDFMFLSL